MGEIHLLDSLTISQIAAGEVVERPASAIKELVENAIDSGADKIIVKISGEEFENIIVEDNGKGIDIEDLNNAFLNHATSKLDSVTDLETLNTMGFRGEAIASINAVSDRVIIQTRSLTHMGARAESRGGSEVLMTEIKIGGNPGTTVEVQGLFNKTPARKKFLKSYVTETKTIEQTFINTALPHIQVHFELYFNGKRSMILPKAKHLQDRISDIFGYEISKTLIHKEYKEDNQISINLYITNPSAFKKTKKIQYSFINNRFIKSPLIHSAITKALMGLSHRDLSPIYFIKITSNPSEFDINVHPRKLEVKFKDEKRIFLLVNKLCRKTLESILSINQNLTSQYNPEDFIGSPNKGNYSKQTSLNMVQEKHVTYSPTIRVLSDSRNPLTDNALEFNKELFSGNESRTNNVDNNTNITQNIDFNNIQTIQVLRTYIVFEYENEVYFIDQHAAAEKIYFEKLILSINKIASKPLLTPIIYSFKTLNDKQVFIEQIDIINKLGFEISDFEPQTIKIEAIPEISEPKDIEEIIESMLRAEESDFAFKTHELNNFNVTKDQYIKLATIACHSSVRAGQKLSIEECREIIKGVMHLQTTPTCPHGRPILSKLTNTDLTKLFRRDI
jgi:DNA mismatch repair protein MutL